MEKRSRCGLQCKKKLKSNRKLQLQVETIEGKHLLHKRSRRRNCNHIHVGHCQGRNEELLSKQNMKTNNLSRIIAKEVTESCSIEYTEAKEKV